MLRGFSGTQLNDLGSNQDGLHQIELVVQVGEYPSLPVPFEFCYQAGCKILRTLTEHCSEASAPFRTQLAAGGRQRMDRGDCLFASGDRLLVPGSTRLQQIEIG